MANFSEFDRIFHPRGVAVVGVSSDPTKYGNMFFSGLIEADSNVYPVNLKEKEILGREAYPSIKDIPHDVDYAVISIPASGVPKVIEDCGKKGVKAVTIYTAEYSESGTKEGIKREKELVDAAKKANVRIIGPNCIGICCPSGRLSFFPGTPKEEGDVGFICQSGGHAEEFAYEAESWGITFSKIISYGNACDVNCEELLAYLAEDPETKIIGIYVEGVKDGRRFIDTLKDAASQKPIVVWKGGITKGGSRAVASHTGSLAGSPEIWSAVIKQSGAIMVNDRDEFADTLSAIRYLSRPSGERVGIVGTGGGASVASTDLCEMNGLSVPLLEEKTMEELGKIVPPLGTSVKNPVDLSYFLMQNFSLLEECTELVAGDPNVDILIVHIGHLGRMVKFRPSDIEIIFEALIDTKEMMADKFPKKPLVVILHPAGSMNVEIEKVKLKKRLVEEGICVYPSISRAARALSNLASLEIEVE
ncbi:MAG: Succinyl-CoA ligase [ADP-forming] subunit alpha [Candidatus Methanolliviera sp. GoM_asphalt]|nr:MAG: Succinyl-CoA ligase [ADP-forming] subunit alpha [Candidatus Methanolliviera sp. GoM_asphalt]